MIRSQRFRAALVAVVLLAAPVLAADNDPPPAGKPCCEAPGADLDTTGKDVPMNDRVERTAAEWRRRLTDLQFRVTRERGTERAFANEYYRHKADGEYRCVCCGAVLFDSAQKYDSGSGWPAFWDTAPSAPIGAIKDESHGMVRTEVVCRICDAHLGHVFADGPEPRGLRDCINSAALEFAAREGGD